MEETTVHTVKAKDSERAKIQAQTEEFLKKNKIDVVENNYCPKQHKVDFTGSSKQNEKKIKAFNNQSNPKPYQSKGGKKGGKISAEMRKNGEYKTHE